MNKRNIYNNENVEHYDYNPEKAQEILEAAGCTRNSDGFYERDGEEIGFVISVMSGEQDRIDIAQAAAHIYKNPNPLLRPHWANDILPSE